MILHKDAQNCIPACSSGSGSKTVTPEQRAVGAACTAQKITSTEMLMLGSQDQKKTPKIFTP